MDIKKIFLYFALFSVIFLLWSNWQQESTKRNQAAQQQAATSGDYVPAALSREFPVDIAEESQLPEVAVPAERLVQVKTDVFAIEIDKLGGNIVSAKLLDYYQGVGESDKPFILLNDEPATRYVAQSGLVQSDGEPQQILFTTEKTDYLLENDEQLVVSLLGKDPDTGAQIEKQFTFARGVYAIDIDYQVNNTTDTVWENSFYTQLVRVEPKDSSSGLFVLSSYTGAAISDPEQKLYQKVSFKKMRNENLDRVITGGWVAMQEHYFLSSWIPSEDQTSLFYSNYDTNTGEYTIGTVGEVQQVAPNAQATFGATLYMGPEISEKLQGLAPGLELTIDYGWLWFISVFLFWLMKHIYSVVGNWGWAIVLVTVLIKLAFYHLSAVSYRSMANLRKLQPRIQALKERYGDDRAKMSQAMMEMYKKEKINPLGGCLPVLVQIPVFIALYWVLIESVELRHAPFIWWIHDLSAKDPYYILPVLMGISMFVMQKLNPPPPDPTMAKMMMIMPLFFLFIFLQFPAGLVLYWLVNNVLSIAQQWYVMRKYR